MANNYLDNLVNELMNQGIQPVSGSNKQCVDDRDLKIIAEMERVTGLKYSDEQRAILEHKGNACILACAGSGKALVNGTGVLTPFGYVNIETLKIGDKVFDQDGREQIVLGVYPQGKKKVHKVHFAAGEMIKCCEEHLWTVKNKYDYWETVKTSDINKMLEHQQGVEIPSVSGSADDFLYGYCSDSYLELLERMLPSKQRFKELLDIENNEQLYEALSVYNSYDDYADTVEIMYKIFEYGNYPILFIKHEEMKNAIVTAFEFFGTSTEVRELDEEERNRYCASYALTFDNHLFDFKQKYITRIEETEEYEEMTCIKVSGLSELFLTEHCIVTHNTSVSTHLIAKRILTGEISDVNKLIYTTYSKAGATEMKERLDKLLKQLGINKDVQVRTLHSFFLQVLRTFGVNSDIISASTRSQYIREACKDAEFIPRDDDLMLVDNLISYQVNNLLNDKKTIDSYVNTLEDLTLEQYTKIRSGYATRKAAKGLIDYDDMQSFLYLWLVKYAKSTNELERQTAEAVRNYCKAVWTDFYIDEAQDVSKIQFAIIRAMVTDPNDKNKLTAGLVFIGDDDQCLAEGTSVYVKEKGCIGIEDVKVGDQILTSCGNGNTVFSMVDTVSQKEVDTVIYKVTTKSGKVIRATGEHVGFKLIDYNPEDYYDESFVEMTLFGGDSEVNGVNTSSIRTKNIWEYCVTTIDGTTQYTENMYKHLNTTYRPRSIEQLAKLTVSDKLFKFTRFNEFKIGDKIPTSDGINILWSTITNIEVVDYKGKVYDLSVPETRNFIADGVVVHNCIYTWRGSDPSIILTVGPTFNMKTFKLTTNYRCYNEIVDYAVNGIKCNTGRYEKGMQASKQGGTTKICVADREDLCSLSILALNHIKWWLKNGSSVKDIAVLSRNNFHLALLSNMLLREGIYCNMTEDMKLTKSYMYQDIKMLLDISEPSWKPDVTQKIMWKLCRFLGAASSKVISEFQNNSALSLEDTLGYIVKHYIDKDIYFEKKLNIPLQASQKMEYFISSKLTAETKNDIHMVYNAISCGDKEQCYKALAYMYIQGTSFLYKSKDKSRSINGLVMYIANLIKKDGFDRMLEFLRVTEQLENGNMVIPGEKLTLTTIHSAKGREWKNVIMFACDNISEPSLDGMVKMMEDDISVHDIFENLNEERRLFYVGNTRAKENLVTITNKEPSVFILEALGVLNDKTDGNNGTILSFAQDRNWFENYRDIVHSIIMDKNSKYFYDKDAYTLN